MAWEVSLIEWLQNETGKAGELLAKLFSVIGGETVMLLVLLVSLFCYSKEAGKRCGLKIIAATIWFPMIKNIVLRLRPYMEHETIRALRLTETDADAMDAVQQGYSFPSGHSVWSSSLYGSTAYYCSRKRLTILSVLLVCAALLTGFSRNFLGVHTPQDVIVGMSEGFIMTFLIAKAYRYTDEHPESMDKFLLGGAVLAAAGMVYIMVKPYPMTYVDGALLVDPVKMRYDGLQDISALIMVMAAVYVDKKWIQYQPVEMKGPQIVIVIAGGAGLYWVITYLKAICIGAAGPEPGRVLYSFLSIFYIMVLVPFVLKMSASKEAGLQEVGAAE